MVFQGTKKTNKGHQVRLQTLSFDLYMKNQGGGGGVQTRPLVSINGGGGGGGGGLQTRPGISARGWLGHSRYHGCLPGGGGGGGATEETMDLYRGQEGLQKRPWASIRGGGGGGYRRDHGSLSEGGGLQTRPWVSIGGRGATGETMRLYNGRGGGKTDTVGLFKWVGGYKRRPSSPLILVGPELV